MRLLPTLTLLALLVAGCTPVIPVKDDFGTSALVPAGTIPPEFAEFNSYDPGMNALTADQVCATHYTELEQKAIPAEPGQLQAWRGRCEPYAVSVVP